METQWARLDLAAGETARALGHAQKAVGLAEQRPGESDTLSAARFVLAQALPATQAAEARVQAQQALGLLRQRPTPAARSRATEVETWLASLRN
jgi:hypothetical protein